MVTIHPQTVHLPDEFSFSFTGFFFLIIRLENNLDMITYYLNHRDKKYLEILVLNFTAGRNYEFIIFIFMLIQGY